MKDAGRQKRLIILVAVGKGTEDLFRFMVSEDISRHKNKFKDFLSRPQVKDLEGRSV
jgi:hypothetical protein